MPPRPKKPSEKKTSALLEAVNFFSDITKDQGTVYETHVLLNNKTIVAYNDFLSAGALIEEDIFCAPNAKTLQTALSKCGQEPYNLTIDGVKIVIKSGKFKANIPCIDPSLLAHRLPDAPAYSLDDTFRNALKCMDLIKPELNAQKIHLLTFMLNGPSCISTDGKMLIEYWHGLQLPIIPIPKLIIAPILKNPKKLYSMGYSTNSITFFFEDNSWIKSQLCVGEWPIDRISEIMNVKSSCTPMPTNFYPGLSAIAPFSKDGTVQFKHDLLCADEAASYECPGIPSGPKFSIKYLQLIKDYAETIDFNVKSEFINGVLCHFYGKQCRGIIAGHG